MNWELIGFTIETLGTVMVAYTAIMVHHRLWKEHKITERVFVAMKTEQIIAIMGVVFIIVGFLLQVSSKI